MRFLRLYLNIVRYLQIVVVNVQSDEVLLGVLIRHPPAEQVLIGLTLDKPVKVILGRGEGGGEYLHSPFIVLAGFWARLYPDTLFRASTTNVQMCSDVSGSGTPLVAVVVPL